MDQFVRAAMVKEVYTTKLGGKLTVSMVRSGLKDIRDRIERLHGPGPGDHQKAGGHGFIPSDRNRQVQPEAGASTLPSDIPSPSLGASEGQFKGKDGESDRIIGEKAEFEIELLKSGA